MSRISREHVGMADAKTRRYIWLIRDQGSHKKAEDGNKG